MTYPNTPRQPKRLRLHELMLDTGQILSRRLSEVVAFGLDKKTLGAVDLEDPALLDNMPEGDKIAQLYRLYRKLGRDQPSARESAQGLPQTTLDRLAHEQMKRDLERLVKGSMVVGEEAKPRDWDGVDKAPPGSYVWVLDAIDGSGPQDTLGFGYSVNVILYITHADRPATPRMAVTVTSSALMLGWIHPGTVGAAYLNILDESTGRPRIAEILHPLADLELVMKERGNWVSAVAAQPKHRELVRPLFEGTRWVVQTLGGAPAMPGLLVDMLSAIVIPTPQTRHDASPLLALASGMGLTFVGITTSEVYSDAHVRRFFLGIERPGQNADNPLYTPVPAMVVARDRDVAFELARDVREHWDLLREIEQKAEGGAGDGRLLRLIDPRDRYDD